MDDFALLKEMADRTPLPSATDLAPGRARLTAAFTQPTTKDDPMTVTATEPNRLTQGRPRRRRRLVFSGIAVVGLAAAITGVVALGGLEQVGVAPPKANAAEVLNQAADAARGQPFTPPRPDQFLYTKVQGSDGSVEEFWHSVDGTHDGMAIQGGEARTLFGCRDGKSAGYNESGELVESPCVPLPAYLPDVPTDPAKMQAYLEGLGGAPGINSLGKNIHYLAQDHYVSPEALAALFESVASIPGLTVDENVTDGAGRPGIGVSWKVDGVDENGKRTKLTNTLVFDPTTHVFLGWADAGALVEKDIVDTAGQRP